jgi:hypothetical protein
MGGWKIQRRESLLGIGLPQFYKESFILVDHMPKIFLPKIEKKVEKLKHTSIEKKLS